MKYKIAQSKRGRLKTEITLDRPSHGRAHISDQLTIWLDLCPCARFWSVNCSSHFPRSRPCCVINRVPEWIFFTHSESIFINNSCRAVINLINYTTSLSSTVSLHTVHTINKPHTKKISHFPSYNLMVNTWTNCCRHCRIWKCRIYTLDSVRAGFEWDECNTNWNFIHFLN